MSNKKKNPSPESDLNNSESSNSEFNTNSSSGSSDKNVSPVEIKKLTKPVIKNEETQRHFFNGCKKKNIRT